MLPALEEQSKVSQDKETPSAFDLFLEACNKIGANVYDMNNLEDVKKVIEFEKLRKEEERLELRAMMKRNVCRFCNGWVCVCT